MSSSSPTSVSIYYQNARGLKSKTHSFYTSSCESNFDIIVITETWLDDSVSNSEIVPSYYNMVRADRKFAMVDRSTGGGVFIALSSSILYEVIDTSQLSVLVPVVDFVMCKCTFQSSFWYLAAIYIPPKLSLHDFEVLCDYLEILLLNKTVLLLGDFNLPEFINVHTSCSKCSALRCFCSSLNVRQFNSIMNCNGRLLDLILSNSCNDITIALDELPFVPVDVYHPPLAITFLQQTLSANSAFPLSHNTLRYNFRKCDFNRLYTDLLKTDWSFLDDLSDADHALAKFYEALTDKIDASTPKYTSRSTASQYPTWFSGSVISNLKHKEFYRRKWKATKSEFYFNEFRKLRVRCKAELRTLYLNYMRKVEDSIIANPKEVFNYIHSKRGTTRIPNSLILGDVCVDTPQGIVNAFADKFSSIYHGPSYLCPDSLHCDSIPFSLTQVTEDEIIGIMSKFPNNFNAGDDLIPAFLLKDARFVLAKPLTFVINLSIETSTFPNLWKRARICPVFKKGDKSLVDNYRPISILSNFAKVFEHVIYSCLCYNTKSIVSNYQHGFLRGRSTVTNLTVITEYISRVLDDRGQVDVIYTDFSRAFDSIDFEILISKLSSLGLSPSFLQLLHSYLYNRCTYVFYNGFRSYDFFPTSGVPQGSNLGPLLFVLFINDLLTSLTCPALAYADDLKIYMSIASNEEVVNLQYNLNIIIDWCAKFNLRLNIPKCCSVSYTRRKSPILSTYAIHNERLKRCDTVKDLGVIFNCQLSFAPHIADLCVSASKTLGFILRSSKYFKNINLLRVLFFSFVISKLEYASSVWSPHYIYLKLAVEKIQRRFLKFLSFKLDGTYPQRNIDYVSLLERHGLQPLDYRREVQGARFIWKLVHGRIDCPFLLSMISFLVPRSSSRSTNTFSLPFPRTNILLSSPLSAMCRAADLHYEDIFFLKM